MTAHIDRKNLPAQDQVRKDRQELLPAIPSPVEQDKRRTRIWALSIIDLDYTCIKFLLFQHNNFPDILVTDLKLMIS
jgi:hypothetical protein